MKWLPTVLAAMAVNLAHASPVVIDFEEFPHADELTGAGELVISKGFLFRYTPAAGEPYPTGLQTVGPSWRFNGRSAAMNVNSCSATVELTAIDNNPFELDSIALAPLNGDPDVSVRFEGTTVHGEKVSHAVRLNPAKRWQRIKLPDGFRRVASVRWLQGDCLVNKPHMFDNVRVRPAKR